MRYRHWACLLLPLLCGVAYAHPPQEQRALPATPSPGAWDWRLPTDFPLPLVPEDNPMSAAKVELGRRLFYERRLSVNATTSCGSCHLQAKAFTDGRSVAVGATGERTPRNAQHLANVAWHGTLTWANPALVTLERQMLVPIFGESPIEMGVNDQNKNVILRRIEHLPDYRRRFRAAFPDEPQAVSWNNIIKAIAAFQRTLISANSRFDRYQRGEIRLSDAEIRGKNLFFGEKAECFHCHGSFNFNDQVVHRKTREPETQFHNTGLYNIDGNGAYPPISPGLIEVSGKPDDMGKFRAPSLRNVEVTAPYMHDGSINTLAEVIATYAAGGRHLKTGPYAGDGRRNPWKSELIGNIDLNEQEQKDLAAFLKTLTDREFLQNQRFANPFPRPARQK